MMRAFAIFFFLALFASGCSTAVKLGQKPVAPPVVIHEVIIRNELPYPVKDVQILSPASGNFVSCGNIVQKTQCSTTFPPRNYSENPVQISWKEWGTARSLAPFALTIPEGFDSGRPASIEITIFSPGQAGAKLVQ
jgi:uncharacterized protein YceK